MDQSTTTPGTTSSPFSMTNMAYLAMPLGAIRIGHTIVKADGSEVPVSNDEFRITQPLRDRTDGHWLSDTLDGKLRSELPRAENGLTPKLKVIPIKFVSNDPSLAIRARFEAFSQNGRSICASNGNGWASRETGVGGRTEVQCNGCDRCEFAQAAGNSCRLFGRVSVQIEGQTSPLGTYVLRTGSINTLRTLETNLRAYHALFGGRLRGVPFNLTLRPMQTKQSAWETFYVVDLDLRAVSLQEALKLAKDAADSDVDLNFDGLNAVLRAGQDNGGAYDLSAMTDGVDLAEFYPASAFTSTYQATKVTQDSGAPADAPGAPQTATVTVLRQRTSPAQARTVDSQGGDGALIEDFDLPPESANKPVDEFAFMATHVGSDVTAMTASL